jgi:tetratricopeptide (TPR) repeat protein
MCRKATNATVIAIFLVCSVLASPQLQPLAKVQSQIDHNHLDAAEASVWSVLSSQPDNQDALLLLATIRNRQLRYAEAEALSKRVLQMNASSSAAERNLGTALAGEGKSQEAIAILHQALAHAPNDTGLRIELARLYVDLKNFGEAAEMLKPIPTSQLPKEAIPVKAAILTATGHAAEAATLIPLVAGKPGLALDLADVFISSRQPELALRTLRPLFTAAHGSARVFYLQGAAQALEGNATAARNSLDQSLKVDPKFTPALVAFADMAASQKKPAESVQWLERAYAADPSSLPALRRLISQSMEAGLHGLAEKYALELKDKGSLPEDKYLAGSVLLQEREYEAAAQLFAVYIAQRPDDSKAHYALGLALLNLQRYPEAQAALEKALQLDPHFTDAEYSLGVLNSREGDNEAAIGHFQRVLQAQPNHSKALRDVGTMYLQVGELQKARTSLESSEIADSSDPDTHYQLSLLYNRLGDNSQARTQMERFQELKHMKPAARQ